MIFLTFRFVADTSARRELHRVPPPAAWASQPPTQWPKLVLTHSAEFRTHTALRGGTASIVRLPSGELAVLTAGHLLAKENGVKPGFTRPGAIGGFDAERLAMLDNEVLTWRVHLPHQPGYGVSVIGLIGPAEKFDRHCDQLLLRLAGPPTNLPVTPLSIRLEPVEMDEPLWVVGFEEAGDGPRQVARAARRVPGLGLTCALATPAPLNGWSGAPVIDRQGRLVAILTGGTLEDFMHAGDPRGFSTHEIFELMPLFEELYRRKARDDKHLASR